MRRPSIDEVLMATAYNWESRSTCSRNHVGAVIAKDGRHIGSGYNGAPAGMPHCEHEVTATYLNLRSGLGKAAADQVGMSTGCRISIHAEANALAYCARYGIATAGATLYTTLSPCYSCAQLIISAGLVRVVYGRAYRDPEGTTLLVAASVGVEQLR